MDVRKHSTVREGLLTGLIGAAIVAVWYLLVDTAGGQPFRTPNALGKIFFRGDLTPGVRQIVPTVVLGYTVFHLVVFALAGLGLTFLVHLASKNITLRMGVWLGLVVALFYLVGLTYMLGIATGERLSLWSVIGGGVLGVLGMAGYLWRTHPRLRRSFDEASLGAEARQPPHPPGGPRAA
ncbi:MAG: hypothetical protein H0T86_04900 [Gemmatimonadales bacterium]|nr:hypothetical protein [Gemmatimonadales bacterium]